MTLLANMFNLHHGPGLHKAIRYVENYFEYVLIMDSDITFNKLGILEDMKAIIPNDFLCCGKLEYINDSGINTNHNQKNALPYIHPHCMYLKVNKYLKFAPTKLHGAPFIDTFKSVKERGMQDLLIDFDVSNYVTHLGREKVIRTGGYHTKNHPKYSDNK